MNEVDAAVVRKTRRQSIEGRRVRLERVNLGLGKHLPVTCGRLSEMGADVEHDAARLIAKQETLRGERIAGQRPMATNVKPDALG